MKLFVISVFAFAMVNASPLERRSTCTIQRNTDRLGGDYKSAKLSFDDCVKACSNDSKCAAVSYHKDNSYCYFKDTVPSAKSDNNVDTAVCKSNPTTTTSKPTTTTSKPATTTTKPTTTTTTKPTTTTTTTKLTTTTTTTKLTTTTTTTKPTTTTTTTTTTSTTTTTATTTTTTTTTTTPLLPIPTTTTTTTTTTTAPAPGPTCPLTNLPPFRLQTLDSAGNILYVSVLNLGGYFAINTVANIADAATFYQRGNQLGYCSGADAFIGDTNYEDNARTFLDPDGQAFGPLIEVTTVGNQVLLSAESRTIDQLCAGDVYIAVAPEPELCYPVTLSKI